MAHHFGVSYQAAAFRLKGLQIVSERELELLRGKEEFGRNYLNILEMWNDLEGQPRKKPDREIFGQVLRLAFEAYRLGLISDDHIKELGGLLGINGEELVSLAKAE